MFDVSFGELLVVFVVVLIVVGPERLPVLVRDAGRWTRKIRRIISETQYELEREFSFEESRKRLKQETKGLTGALDELDDLMKIAPDRDPDIIQSDTTRKDTS